jgi:uncharacterized protein YbjQ (UPF0145 family)
MKNVMAIVLILLSCSSQARDTALFLSIDDAMTTVDAKQRLNQGIKFVFGENVVNAKSTYGTFVSNKKTNAFNKSDQQACNWVFLSSILALQKRALAEGGDAVVNIHSYYKKREHHSREEFECHTGAIMAGVALRGTVVKLTK